MRLSEDPKLFKKEDNNSLNIAKFILNYLNAYKRYKNDVKGNIDSVVIKKFFLLCFFMLYENLCGDLVEYTTVVVKVVNPGEDFIHHFTA